jgi:hypothetical protein
MLSTVIVGFALAGSLFAGTPAAADDAVVIQAPVIYVTGQGGVIG